MYVQRLQDLNFVFTISAGLNEVPAFITIITVFISCGVLY